MHPGFRSRVRLLHLPVITVVACGILYACSDTLFATETSTAESADLAGYTPPADPLAPITVGPRELLGKKSMGEKAAAGLVGGLLGSALGGGGSGKAAERPRTRRDPSRKQDYVALEHGTNKLRTEARSLWTEDGLLISARVDKSPDHGTFQAVFLQSCDGQRLYPQEYAIYQLWSEQSLSVSWSKTTSSNGRVVSQQSGGWSDTWSEDFTPLQMAHSPLLPATWQELGFDRAEGGARELGATFRLSPAQLRQMDQLALFVHVTEPALDPVSTTASAWLLRPDSAQAPRLQAGGSSAASSDAAQSDGWQQWQQRCAHPEPLLLADAGDGSLASAAGGSTDVASPAMAAKLAGGDVPAGVQFLRPKGTGQTTGHIIDLTIRNDTSEPWDYTVPAMYIPSTGKYQSYVVPGGERHSIAPGTVHTVPVKGYCGDVRRPPVPAGVAMPPLEDWIVPGADAPVIAIPDRENAAPPGRAMLPGTDTALPRAVNPGLEPEVAGPLLLGALREIEQKTTELQQSGELRTPFSGNPEREHQAVVQQTIWLYAAELEGEPYTREEFTQRLESQYEDRTGVPIASASDEEQQKLQQGADSFWDAFELVGVEAKVISHGPAATAGKPEPTEALPGVIGEPPAENVKPPPCTPREDVNHSPKTVDVTIADSYGNDETRKKIRDGIRNAVQSNEAAYATATPPATAYSIWGHDHIGGISSAYAKVVFLEDNDQEWVWSTDPMDTRSRGTGIHTLSFNHGPECKSVVAGAALMWIKASSHAFDPLENSIEVFRVLDGVKEVSVKYVTDKFLPPGLSDAAEAGVDAITDPSSDTYAGATGNATLTVGGSRDQQSANNAVTYKRKDKEDKAVVGGGETIKKLFASDVKPGSLSSVLEAEAHLRAGATGNGLAKAWLESLYGTLLIGVCECPGGSAFHVLYDSGQFIRSEAAKQAVERAKQEMQQAAERINKSLANGQQRTDAASLKARAEGELKAWAESMGGDRFKPKDDKAGQ